MTVRQRYRVLIGMNYPAAGRSNRRANVGDIVDDVPKASIKWLLEAEAIEPYDGLEPLSDIPGILDSAAVIVALDVATKPASSGDNTIELGSVPIAEGERVGLPE